MSFAMAFFLSIGVLCMWVFLLPRKPKVYRMPPECRADRICAHQRKIARNGFKSQLGIK